MGKTKIDQAKRAIGTKDDVGGLEIVVDETALVHVGDRRANLTGDGQGRLFWQRPSAAKCFGQRLSGDVLGHDVRAALVDCQGQETQNAGMVELAAYFLLLLEQGPTSNATREDGKRDLDHYLLLPSQILGEIEDGHAASPKLVAQAKAAVEDLSRLDL